MAKEKKVVKEDVKLCSVEITVNEQTQSFSGDSILECLQQFVAPDFIKTDVLLKADVSGSKSEANLGVFKARRTFGNNTAMILLASLLEKRLNG